MGWIERITAIVAGVAAVAAVSVLVARSDATVIEAAASPQAAVAKKIDPTTAPTKAPASTKAPAAAKLAAPTNIGALTTTAPASVRTRATFRARSIGIIPTGYILPVMGRHGEFFRIYTPRENIGWVHESKVVTHEKAGKRPRHSLKGATIVIDPGHGGHLPGAKGPAGLTEAEVNLEISRRLASELRGARIILTRGTGHAGLKYRSAIANRLGAHAFISMHNNALPDYKSKTPGTEVYYQRASHDSKRIAGLIYEELYRALKQMDIVWGKDPFAGAKYRKSHQHGGEYYAVLRRTLVPAVIVEGMFITNGAEEQLLRRPIVRQIYADAVARGIIRFFTTNDSGSGFKDPYAKPTPNCPIPGCFEHRK